MANIITAPAKPAAASHQPARASSQAKARSRQPLRVLKARLIWASTIRFRPARATAHSHSPAKRLVMRVSSPHRPRLPAPMAASNGSNSAARVPRTGPAKARVMSINRALMPSHCGQSGRFETGPASTPLSCRSASNSPQ
ncbi:hypothetical protein D9M71_419650 [compost metagenome]